MKTLPLNLIYVHTDKKLQCLISSPYYFNDKKLIAIETGKMAWALKEQKFSWLNAMLWLSTNRIESVSFLMPKKNELKDLLPSSGKYHDLFLQTVQILKEEGVEVDSFTGDLYWSDEALSCERYIAIDRFCRMGLEHFCAGETPLYLRPCLRFQH